MKRLVKILALVLTVFMVVGLLGACNNGTDNPSTGDSSSQESSSGDTPSTGADIKVAYVSGLLTNEIFAMQVKAMEEYCAEVGVELLNTPCADDAAKIAAVENYTQMGVDVIICHVSTPDAMVDVMKRAQDAGIKFFSYDTPVEGDDAFFGWDNYDYGYAIGANAANWVNENFDDGEVCNTFSLNVPTADFIVVRHSGIKAALDELCGDKINWAGEAVGGASADGVTAGENWLQSGTDINLALGINDAGALGVYEALNAANVGGEKVAVFAGDATSDAINAMQQTDSIYRGTVLTGLVNYAPKFIDIAINLANGVEEEYYFGGLWFITPENVSAYAASGSADDLELYKDYYTMSIDEYWAQKAS